MGVCGVKVSWNVPFTLYYGLGEGGEKAAQEYGVPFLGKIPLEPATALGGDAGTPVITTDPEGIFGQVIMRAAHGIMEQVARA